MDDPLRRYRGRGEGECQLLYVNGIVLKLHGVLKERER